MSYATWQLKIPSEVRGDVLWRTECYRQALYAADLGWADVTRLVQDRRTRSLGSQLNDALGSISANIAEGFSRGSGADRVRFYEYALGSAREARDWYFKSRHVLGRRVVRHGLRLLTSVIRLLLAAIPTERGRSMRPVTD